MIIDRPKHKQIIWCYKCRDKGVYYEQENQRLKRILKETVVYAKNNSLFGELYDADEILSLCNSTE